MVVINNLSYGFIYKLIDLRTGYYYIGSTFKYLGHRLKKHIAECKRSQIRLIYKHLNNWEDIKIFELKKIETEEKKILMKEEKEIIIQNINNDLCVNSRITGQELTLKEYNKQYYKEHINREKEKQYRNNNKESIKVYKKEHYKKNKDKIKERLTEKISCECGSIITKQVLYKHVKTTKHKNYMEDNIKIKI